MCHDGDQRMPRVYLYNPQNDFALAKGVINYTPAKTVRSFRDACQALPLWLCREGDLLAVRKIDADWLDSVKEDFSLKGELFLPPKSFPAEYVGAPWGWSMDARHQLLAIGLDAGGLPSAEQINRIRELSHRRMTIPVNARLKDALSFATPSLPREARDIGELERFLSEYPRCFLKFPWSGSGRGVIDASALPVGEVLRRASGVIARQGSILCEERLDKVRDFAMLFLSDGEKASFAGYSLFFTDHAGTYAGNLLAGDELIFDELSRLVPSKRLTEISSELEKIFTGLLAADYKGYFGVDMMIYRQGEKLEIAPCVEVNLRMTMGVVAWVWTRRYLDDESLAVMRVSRGRALRAVEKPEIISCKLRRGRVDLVPLNDRFNIVVEAVRRPGQNFLSSSYNLFSGSPITL